jgi:poly(3-hydroxybutyrate) depolymerase
MFWNSLALLALTAVAATAVLATSSSGCGKTPTLKTGNQANIQVNGKSRQWILHLPTNYDNKRPYRLIFGLHWRNGQYTDVVSGKFYNLEPLSNNSAIFIAPNGLNSGWANSNGEDITFIKSILSLVEGDLCVDQTLRYSVGWSYGGAMSCKFNSLSGTTSLCVYHPPPTIAC